jgi:hypothetical protein
MLIYYLFGELPPGTFIFYSANGPLKPFRKVVGITGSGVIWNALDLTTHEYVEFSDDTLVGVKTRSTP